MPFEMATLEKYAVAGDRIGYWDYLPTNGFHFRDLALGVVFNETLLGETANTYAKNIADLSDISLSSEQWGGLGQRLMMEDLALWQKKSSATLTYKDIRDYHISVYNDFGIPDVGYTAYVPIALRERNEGTSAAAACWDDLIDGLTVFGSIFSAIDAVRSAFGSIDIYLVSQQEIDGILATKIKVV